MSRIKQALLKARSLLAKGWTKGAYAKNNINQRVAPDSPEAVKWCIIGALNMGCAEAADPRGQLDIFRQSVFDQVSSIVFAQSGESDLGRWNDKVCKSQAQALRVVDAAIAGLDAKAAA